MTTSAVIQQTSQLYLPDGTLLAGGVVHDLDALPDGQRVMLVVERPYRFLQECLLGGRNELFLSYDGGPRRLARIEQILFYYGVGRVCTLFVSSQEAD
ncbi:MAG: hypothetical protein AB7R89_13320 [Dehalococcoidia bacterium]